MVGFDLLGVYNQLQYPLLQLNQLNKKSWISRWWRQDMAHIFVELWKCWSWWQGYIELSHSTIAKLSRPTSPATWRNAGRAGFCRSIGWMYFPFPDAFLCAFVFSDLWHLCPQIDCYSFVSLNCLCFFWVVFLERSVFFCSCMTHFSAERSRGWA